MALLLQGSELETLWLPALSLNQSPAYFGTRPHVTPHECDFLPAVAALVYGAPGGMERVCVSAGTHVHRHTLTLIVLSQSIWTLTPRHTDPAALLLLTAPAVPQISAGRPTQTPALLIHLPSGALHRCRETQHFIHWENDLSLIRLNYFHQ